MTVTIRHNPPLWEIHAPYRLLDGSTYLAGLMTEEQARAYARGHGWVIAGEGRIAA